MRESFGIRVYKEYFNFGSAHFLIFDDGSREELHGHNYKVRVEVWGDASEGGVVIDFIKFKPLVKRICDDLDHRTLLPLHNPNLEIDAGETQVDVRHRDGSTFSFPRADVRLLETANTSTELLARYIARELLAGLGGDTAPISSLTVEVEESPGQCGIFRVDLDR